MWLNELWRRWTGQAPRQLRRRRRSPRGLKRLTLEALEDRTLLSGGGVTSTTGLISAINTANSSGGATTITLAASTTFDFTHASGILFGFNALPVITGNVTIVGSGNDTIERTGPAAIRLFGVTGGGSLTLENLTLQGGWTKGVGGASEGGAIFSTGTLALSGVAVLGNKAQGSNGANGVSGSGGNGADAFGGGLYVQNGSVSLSNDLFNGNVAQGGNGGNGASLKSSSDGGNGGSGAGGGLYVAGGGVSLSGVKFDGNSVLGGLGGNGGNAIFNAGRGGNGGSGTGGGVDMSLGSSSSTLSLSNDTFRSNAASGNFGGHGGNAIHAGSGGAGGNAAGGGLYVAQSPGAGSVSLTLTSDTFINNTGYGGYGGFGGHSFLGIGPVRTGGDGGTGGNAEGGGLYAAVSSLSLSSDNVSTNGTLGGLGGDGGNGSHSSRAGQVSVHGGAGGTGGYGSGGGLYATGGSVSLSSVTLNKNRAQGGGGGGGGTNVSAGGGGGGSGGGLFVLSANGVVTLSNDTTLSSNFAQGGNGGNGGLAGHGGGGGIGSGGCLAVLFANSVTLSNDTLSFNDANGGNGGNGGNGDTSGRGSGGSGGDASGGGLEAEGGNVTLSNDTLSFNDANGGLGGAGGNGLSGVKFAGHGGKGGDGGNAAGGGLSVTGSGSSVILSNDTLGNNAAYGGVGGNGGNGGIGENGGYNSDVFGIATGGSGGTGGSSTGGGLYVTAASSAVTLSNDTVSGNFAVGGGGGLGGKDGTFDVRDGERSGAGGAGGNATGGGLDVAAASSVNLSGDTLNGNEAVGGAGGNGGNGDSASSAGGGGGAGGAGGFGAGGGLYVAQSAVTLVNDTLYGNLAQGGAGGAGGAGGIGGGNGGSGGAGGNASYGAGGGLYLAQGAITLINDTLSGNSAAGGNGGNGGNGNKAKGNLGGLEGFGGGGGNAGNGGDSGGGGLFVISSSVNTPQVDCANTLIAENSIPLGLAGTVGKPGTGSGFGSPGSPGSPGSDGTASAPDVSAVVTSSDSDLIGDPSGSFGFDTLHHKDILNVTALQLQLGPLASNGGPTQTMALLPNSPAIQAGDASAPGLGLANGTDQRGYSRFVVNALGNETVDIGAYESGGTPPPQTPALSIGGSGGSSTSPGGPITYTLTVTNNSSTAQSNVDVADQLPANTTLVSWTAAAGWSSSVPPAGSSSGTVSASIASLAANSSATFTLVVQVAAGTPVHTVINNTASFGPFADVTNPSANSASVNTTVLYAPTIQVVDGGGTYNGNPFPATATAVGIDGTTPVAGTFSYAYYAGTSVSGTPLSAVPVNAGTYTVVAAFTSSDPDYSNGAAQTTFTIAQATTALSNLTVQQIIVGTNATTVSGQLTSNTVAIPIGQSVAITLNGVTQYATVATDGSFSNSFATGALGVGSYPITYSYAGDSNFTAASGTGSLTVAYGSQLLFHNSKPVHSGAVLPIKLALTDANGADISAANIAVAATGLVDANGHSLPLNSPGNANPNDLFRYDPGLGGYIFNLDTKGLAAGTYTLYYTAGNDPTRHSLTFVVD